jgi:hypothetical protein
VTVFSQLFSTCPRVSKRGHKLVASTAWRLRLLTLGWLFRKVIVDPVDCPRIWGRTRWPEEGAKMAKVITVLFAIWAKAGPG